MARGTTKRSGESPRTRSRVGEKWWQKNRLAIEEERRKNRKPYAIYQCGCDPSVKEEIEGPLVPMQLYCVNCGRVLSPKVIEPA